MTAVLIVDEAEEQLREIVAWWIENRPGAQGLVVDELTRCVSCWNHRRMPAFAFSGRLFRASAGS